MSINLGLPPSQFVDTTTGKLTSSAFRWLILFLKKVGSNSPNFAMNTDPFIITTVTDDLVNAQVLSQLPSGFVTVAQGTGLLNSQKYILSNNLQSTGILAGDYTFNGLTYASVNAQGQLTFLKDLNLTGLGTVTSITFTGDGTILSSTPSSAVTTSGTLTATLATQTAHYVLAGPTSGGATTPTFRALIASDIPTLNQNTSGSAASLSSTLTVSSGGTNNTTFTAYMPVTAGTTSTGTFQSIATGTQYYPLCYNTSGSLPTFQQLSLTAAVTGTLPRTNGGTGVTTIPSFCVLSNGGTSTTLATSAVTLILFGASTWDTATAYTQASSKYTPTIAGTYLVTAQIYLNGPTTATQYQLILWKNGSTYAYGDVSDVSGTTTYMPLKVTSLVQVNGSTDYIQIAGYNTSGVTTVSAVALNFSAVWVGGTAA